MTTYCLRTNWGWVVAFCAFVHFVFILGSLYNYSILFLSFQHEFQSGAAATGWVGSIANALSCLLSPVSSLVLRRVSCRTGSVLGVVVFSAGLVITSFATELWHTFLAFGILTGVGSNLLMVSDLTELGRWFEGGSFYRASAVITVGSSAGMMVMSLVLTFLISAFDWRHSLRLLGAGVLVLGCLPALVALREPGPIGARPASPSQEPGRGAGEEETAPLGRPAAADDETVLDARAAPVSNGAAVETRLVTEKSPAEEEVEEKVEEEEEEEWEGSCDWGRVLRLSDTWLFGVAVTLSNNAYTFANINMGSFMQELEFTKEDISLVIFLFAGSECLGKGAMAAISKRLNFSLMYLHVATCLLAALVIGMMALGDQLFTLALCACAFGLARSSLYGLAYGGSKELFGGHGMAAVNAFSTIPYGVGTLLSAPITGGLYDVTGNYTLSLLVIIACFVTSSGCFLLIPLRKKRRTACLPCACVATEVKGRDHTHLESV